MKLIIRHQNKSSWPKNPEFIEQNERFFEKVYQTIQTNKSRLVPVQIRQNIRANSALF